MVFSVVHSQLKFAYSRTLLSANVSIRLISLWIVALLSISFAMKSSIAARGFNRYNYDIDQESGGGKPYENIVRDLET